MLRVTAETSHFQVSEQGGLRSARHAADGGVHIGLHLALVLVAAPEAPGLGWHVHPGLSANRRERRGTLGDYFWLDTCTHTDESNVRCLRCCMRLFEALLPLFVPLFRGFHAVHYLRPHKIDDERHLVFLLWQEIAGFEKSWAKIIAIDKSSKRAASSRYREHGNALIEYIY